jgi:phosphohistidine phosphatase
MKIYILRHGKAEPRSPGKRDADRKLTPEGKRGVRDVITLARNAKVNPERIYTSGLRRADETAAIAAEILDAAPPVVTRNLEPSANPAALSKELPKLSSVMLVGHEPHLSQLVQFLLGFPIGINFRKGAIVCIEEHTLEWMITPRLARSKSLP